MTERDQVAATCPACSPETQTVHEVLRPDGESTVQCMDCGHTHTTRVSEQTTTDTRVVVSQSGDSFTASAAVPPDETLAVGEEFVLDDEAVLMTVRITSLELPDDERVERARGEAIETIWTRAVDNVEVDVTIHPGDGSTENTRSVTVRVPGDQEFVVGDSHSLNDETVRIERVLAREDAVNIADRMREQRGASLAAKNVKRVYARDESTDAWSAW